MINSNIGYIICESDYTAQRSNVVADNNTLDLGNQKVLPGKSIAEVILQEADEKNRNGRFYAKEELFPQLTAPRTLELLRSGTLRAECGHPLSKDLQRQSTIDDTKTCARILKLWTVGNQIFAYVCGTNGPLGQAFDLDLKEGCLPAWSLRALGSVNQTRRGAEVKNLRVITWDNVIYPSHPGAYTQKVVSESAFTEADRKNNLQSLVESTEFSEILEENDIYGKGAVSPIINNDVIRFLEQDSKNLKFVRECFDFAYSGIQANPSGTKVVLTTNEGDTMVINMESYIHNELMTYSKDYDQIRESSANDNDEFISYSFYDEGVIDKAKAIGKAAKAVAKTQEFKKAATSAAVTAAATGAISAAVGRASSNLTNKAIDTGSDLIAKRKAAKEEAEKRKEK